MGTIESCKYMSRGLTYIIAKGAIESEDILNWIENYYSGIVTKMLYWDLRAADLSKITSGELKEISAIVQKKYRLRPGGKAMFFFDEDVSERERKKIKKALLAKASEEVGFDFVVDLRKELK